LCKEIYFLILTNPSIYEVRFSTGLFLLLMFSYYVFYKPYLTLSQFTSQEGKQTLADYVSLAKDVYAVGRLDYDSEGLLILTNDAELNHRLLNPNHKHVREYWAQVEGSITQQALNELSKGVTISIDGKPHKTLPAMAKAFTIEPLVAERNPPIRFRKNIPTSWISLALTEGKNRQVRRMTAKVGFPTLRLIRHRIENITLQQMQPGELKQLSKQEMYKGLFKL
jgi:23S rRNA pseudouridine2457 synthase